MKRILTLIIIFSWLTPIYAREMISLKEYLILNENDNSDAVNAYVSKRCSATFLVVAKIFGDNTLENKKVFDQMVIKGSDLMTAAATIEANSNNRNVNQVIYEVRDQIEIMVDNLMQISDECYAKTGVYLTPHVEDLTLCNSIFD